MPRKQAEKPKQRGGARPGSGRPALKNPRTSVLSISLTATEREQLRAKGTAWCRDTLLSALRG